jgi:hypothetical protein
MHTHSPDSVNPPNWATKLAENNPVVYFDVSADDAPLGKYLFICSYL